MTEKAACLNFQFKHKVVCHPYRTARVTNWSIEIDRDSDVGIDLENSLAKAAEVKTDNHVVYSINDEMHIWCTDGKILIGTKISKEMW